MKLYTLIALLLLAEGLVRLTWNTRMGEPGLVLGHPRRIEILAPDYTGYFNGQPLRINKLGFRDDREYSLTKLPKTFRIVVLGDSVTFGDGVRFEDTWTYLLEKRLKEWNPSVDWQVWNLGVPGYDLSMQYRTLMELAPSFKPDLVIEGFYKNLLNGRNYPAETQDSLWKYRIRWFLRRNIYLFTQIRLWYGELMIAKGDATGAGEKRNSQLISKPLDNPIEYNLDKMQLKHLLPNADKPSLPKSVFKPEGELFNYCDRDVKLFKDLNHKGDFSFQFFINISPDVDLTTDRFVDGPENAVNQFLLNYLQVNGKQPPSTFDAFWAYRPSELPGAHGHGLAPTNFVKSKVLFDYLINENDAIRRLKP